MTESVLKFSQKARFEMGPQPHSAILLLGYLMNSPGKAHCPLSMTSTMKNQVTPVMDGVFVFKAIR